jgi:hypothetical protein
MERLTLPLASSTPQAVAFTVAVPHCRCGPSSAAGRTQANASANTPLTARRRAHARHPWLPLTAGTSGSAWGRRATGVWPQMPGRAAGQGAACLQHACVCAAVLMRDTTNVTPARPALFFPAAKVVTDAAAAGGVGGGSGGGAAAGGGAGGGAGGSGASSDGAGKPHPLRAWTWAYAALLAGEAWHRSLLPLRH